MASLLFNLLCTLCILTAYFSAVTFAENAGDSTDKTGEASPQETKNADPLKNLFSEMNTVMLSADKKITEQVQSLRDLEDRIFSATFGQTRTPRNEHIHQVRESYRDLQKRLGEAVRNPADILASASNLFGVNVKNKGSKSVVDISMPFLPIKISLDSKLRRPGKADVKEGVSYEGDAPADKSSFSGQINVGRTAIHVHTKGGKSSVDVSQGDVSLKDAVNSNFQKRSGAEEEANPISQQLAQMLGDSQTDSEIKDVIDKLLEDTEKSNYLLRHLEAEAAKSPNPKAFMSRQGLMAVESENEVQPRGRTLNDLLNSEASFGRKLRKLLRSPAKWILDPTLFPHLPQQDSNQASNEIVQTQPLESLNEEQDSEFYSTTESVEYEPTTEAYMSYEDSESEEVEAEDPSETPDPMKQYSPYYYDGSDAENDVSGIEFAAENEQSETEEESDDSNTMMKRQGYWRPDDMRYDSYNDKVILAFSPDGVPMRLRLPPTVEDPIDFLESALVTAGVSLSIPVERYNGDVTPVGTEVLQLGTGIRSSAARALYFDLSSSRQLSSFLENLRWSQNPESQSYSRGRWT